jgi:hypothetical protein
MRIPTNLPDAIAQQSDALKYLEHSLIRFFSYAGEEPLPAAEIESQQQAIAIALQNLMTASELVGAIRVRDIARTGHDVQAILYPVHLHDEKN